jgi:serine/threonine protein kinase
VPGFYNKSIDLWSTGLILYEMVKGQPLFSESSELALIKAIIRQLGPLDNRLIELTILNCELDLTTPGLLLEEIRD